MEERTAEHVIPLSDPASKRSVADRADTPAGERQTSGAAEGVDMNKVAERKLAFGGYRPPADEKINMCENCDAVLSARYLMKDGKGKPCETPEDMFSRVANNIAEAEERLGNPEMALVAAAKFYDMMTRWEFMPNSPTLMNAGRELQQLSACYVLPVEDSVDSIFNAVKNAALIHKSGGGTGFSFSRLRPAQDIVHTSHGKSSGPLSFARVFNEATEAINQGGFRRGANMGILRVDHPDIFSFVDFKVGLKSMNNFNISVAATDEFMKAVTEDGSYWTLNPRNGKKAKELRAHEVFDRIVHNSWQNGEPGIIFIDRINEDNPTPLEGDIESTNPCGEQPLLPYEACNLGSINLGAFVTEKDGIDYARLGETVEWSVRYLDNVIEVNRYPLDEIHEMVMKNRKIGLGVMGFADMLFKMEVPYNSERALELADEVMGFIQERGHAASENLAAERGAFPNFDESIYAEGAPLRNATVTTIAPTGTISIIAGASGGIEPMFSLAFSRNVLDGKRLIEVNPVFKKVAEERGFYSEELMDRIARTGTIAEMEEVPADVRCIFVCAHDITPEWHIRMQAAFQKHTDNAVSKTINFPESATAEEIRDAFLLAYSLGTKGVTVYRNGSRKYQPMALEEEETAPEQASLFGGGKRYPRARPDCVTGATWKMNSGCGKLYITVNEDENREPFELFTSMGKAGGCAASQTEAISRLVSLALRSRIDIEEIIDQLKGISCHNHVFGPDGKILSCADGIAKGMEKYVGKFKPNGNGNGNLGGDERSKSTGKTRVIAADNKPGSVTDRIMGACPDCGGILDFSEGCIVCHGCGYSKC